MGLKLKIHNEQCWELLWLSKGVYTTETPRVTREYYEQLYANKLDSLEETHGFLELNKCPRLNHE